MFAKGRITTTGDVFRDEKSLAFDGSNDYVELGGTFSYNVHSISAWVKPKAILGSSTIFDYRDANNDGILVTLADGDVVYQIDNTDGHYNSVLTLNQWWHIVATNDGSTSTIYVNGVSVETADTSGETINVSGSAIPRIGARSHTSADNYFNGNISEVAIYNSALTINQVKTIYNGREPYNHKEGVASGNLQAWYRMGDGVIDDYALIGDETNTTLGSNLITSFTNGSTYAFDTFSTSDNNISSAIETSGNWAGAASNSLNLTDGEIYKCTFDLTYNSGDDTLRVLLVNSANGAATSVVDVVYYTNTNGSNVFYFKVKTTDSTSHLQLGTWHSSDVINFSATNIKLKKVNGNAGYMTNMEAIDIEGDTP
tara:strand:+ start:802 stop:1908 length:1107 start_codon:yes stop_codon:yes gene_type:complete